MFDRVRPYLHSWDVSSGRIPSFLFSVRSSFSSQAHRVQFFGKSPQSEACTVIACIGWREIRRADTPPRKNKSAMAAAKGLCDEEKSLLCRLSFSYCHLYADHASTYVLSTSGVLRTAGRSIARVPPRRQKSLPSRSRRQHRSYLRTSSRAASPSARVFAGGSRVTLYK